MPAGAGLGSYYLEKSRSANSESEKREKQLGAPSTLHQQSPANSKDTVAAAVQSDAQESTAAGEEGPSKPSLCSRAHRDSEPEGQGVPW